MLNLSNIPKEKPHSFSIFIHFQPPHQYLHPPHAPPTIALPSPMQSRPNTNPHPPGSNLTTATERMGNFYKILLAYNIYEMSYTILSLLFLRCCPVGGCRVQG